METFAQLPDDAITCKVKEMPDYFHQNNLVVAKETFANFDQNSKGWYQKIPDHLLPLVIKLYSDIHKLYEAGFAIVPPPNGSLQNIEELPPGLIKTEK